MDKSLWCNILEVARTIPHELACLEIGIEPIRFIIMIRRLIYLKYILNKEETSLVKKFLNTQMENPKKKDWIKTVKCDLESLGIKLSMKEIENMPKATYKKLIKKNMK